MSLNTIVNQGTTAQYQGTLVDETGAVVPGSTLSTLTLTLVDTASGKFINGRCGQNVLNVNGVVVNSSGVLTWTLTPADTTMVDPTRATEARQAVFIATWGSGKQLQHEYDFTVRALPQP